MRLRPALFLFVLIATLSAQDTFHTQSREVLVPVTVTDKNGAFVDNLTVSDFELLDDGVPRPIASMDTFGTGEVSDEKIEAARKRRSSDWPTGSLG